MYNGVNEKQDNESSTGTNMTKAHPNKLPLSEKMTTAFNKQQRDPIRPPTIFRNKGSILNAVVPLNLCYR
jgi:hypothetical protein